MIVLNRWIVCSSSFVYGFHMKTVYSWERDSVLFSHYELQTFCLVSIRPSAAAEHTQTTIIILVQAPAEPPINSLATLAVCLARYFRSRY